MDEENGINNLVAVNNNQLDCTTNTTVNDETVRNVAEPHMTNQHVEINSIVTNDNKEESNNSMDNLASNSECFTSSATPPSNQDESDNTINEGKEYNDEEDITSSVFTKSRSRKFRVLDSDSEDDNREDEHINKSGYQNEMQVCLSQFYELIVCDQSVSDVFRFCLKH